MQNSNVNFQIATIQISQIKKHMAREINDMDLQIWWKPFTPKPKP